MRDELEASRRLLFGELEDREMGRPTSLNTVGRNPLHSYPPSILALVDTRLPPLPEEQEKEFPDEMASLLSPKGQSRHSFQLWIKP